MGDGVKAEELHVFCRGSYLLTSLLLHFFFLILEFLMERAGWLVPVGENKDSYIPKIIGDERPFNSIHWNLKESFKATL